jgi:hypothetical protein
MSISRIVLATGALALLAACGGNTNPPPAQQAAATTTTTTTTATAAPAAPAAAPASAPANTQIAADDPRAPLMGTWAPDPASCDSPPITITPSRFLGAENQCDMATLEDNGDGSFTTTLSCTSQGQSNTEKVSMRPLFAPSGEAIGIVWLDRNNQESTVYRCGAAAP